MLLLLRQRMQHVLNLAEAMQDAPISLQQRLAIDGRCGFCLVDILAWLLVRRRRCAVVVDTSGVVMATESTHGPAIVALGFSQTAKLTGCDGSLPARVGCRCCCCACSSPLPLTIGASAHVHKCRLRRGSLSTAPVLASNDLN
jgi:hypothetical protein